LSKKKIDPRSKKYYWLKLEKDFFKRHDIKIVETMDNGKDYILFYLKLMLESVSHQGLLRFNEAIPYDEKMLSIITNTNIDIVRTAIKIFTELHLMKILDDQTYYLTEVEKMMGFESGYAIEKRKQRAEIESMGQCPEMSHNIYNSISNYNSNYISNNSLKDLKEDNNILDNNEGGNNGGKNYHKSIEYRDNVTVTLRNADTLISNSLSKSNSLKEDKRFKKPTIEEIKEYCIERNNNIDAEQFFNFYESKGWLVGKNSMKDWKASVRTWEKRNQDNKEERKELDYGDIFKGKYEV
jgi:predicted phage replisome organizer